jgi:hypothetical protein
VAGVLNLTKQRLGEAEVVAEPVDRLREAKFASEHRAFGAHDGQRQKPAVVAAQPGQQPGPQK